MLGVLLLVPCLGVASCSGGRGAGAKPTVNPYAVSESRYAAEQSASASASAAASASASAAPSLSAELVASREAALSTPLPDRLEGMDENTPRGARLTAEYFIGLKSYTLATGDTGPWLEISDKDCVYCQSIAALAKEVHDFGGWVEPWENTLHSGQYGVVKPEGVYSFVDIVYSSPVVKAYDGEGVLDETAPEEGARIRLVMSYESGRWVISKGIDLNA